MAWNRAVKTALGDIIVFLDDDVVLENRDSSHIS